MFPRTTQVNKMRRAEALLKEMDRCLDRARAIALLLASGDNLEKLGDVWTFDAIKRLLVAPNGTVIRLTRPEALVIKLLEGLPGYRATYDQLLTVLSDERDIDRARLAVHIHRLRKKGLSKGLDIPLVAERAAGYAFLAHIVDGSEIKPKG
jgi:DNA-binding response OmpR family regulator